MNPAKPIAAVSIGMIMVILAYVLWSQQRQLVELRANARTSSETRVIQKRLVELQREAQELQAQLKTLPAVAVTATPPRTELSAAEAAARVTQLRAVRQEAVAENMYGPLFRRLAQEFDLTAQQFDGLRILLVQRRLSSRDPNAIAVIEENIGELIGTEGLERYRSFEKNVGSHWRAEPFAELLRTSGNPLSAEQKDRFAETLAAAREETGKWSPVFMGSVGTSGPPELHQLPESSLRRLAEILSASQWQMLKSYQEELTWREQMAAEISRVRRELTESAGR